MKLEFAGSLRPLLRYCIPDWHPIFDTVADSLTLSLSLSQPSSRHPAAVVRATSRSRLQLFAIEAEQNIRIKDPSSLLSDFNSFQVSTTNHSEALLCRQPALLWCLNSFIVHSFDVLVQSHWTKEFVCRTVSSRALEEAECSLGHKCAASVLRTNFQTLKLKLVSLPSSSCQVCSIGCVHVTQCGQARFLAQMKKLCQPCRSTFPFYFQEITVLVRDTKILHCRQSDISSLERTPACLPPDFRPPHTAPQKSSSVRPRRSRPTIDLPPHSHTLRLSLTPRICALAASFPPESIVLGTPDYGRLLGRMGRCAEDHVHTRAYRSVCVWMSGVLWPKGHSLTLPWALLLFARVCSGRTCTSRASACRLTTCMKT